VTAEAPDVVCLDLQVPGMPGWDVLRALHASHPALPAIIVSAVNIGDPSRALDVLTKSVDVERLEAAIVGAAFE
jgi:CheY-like chemotaxis protein